MAVARMKKFQLAGPRKDLDYISYEIINSNYIQLLSTSSKDNSIQDDNPYIDLINKIGTLLQDLEIEPHKGNIVVENIRSIDLAQIREEVEPVFQRVEKLTRMEERLQKEKDRLIDLKRHIWLMRNMDLDLEELKNLSYISLIFGSVGREAYERLIKNIVDLPILILEVYRDNSNVWFFSFTKKRHEERVLSILDSVYFERIELPPRVKGQPSKILDRADKRLERIENIQKQIKQEYSRLQLNHEEKLNLYYHQLKVLNKIREIGSQYYSEVDYLFLLNGWIPEEAEIEFKKTLQSEFPGVIYSSQEVDFNQQKERPPTFLKNMTWVKPFESLVKLYGIPRYGEVDPSLFMAITYLLMFGMMFGDVGQGLVFALGGWLISSRIIKFSSVDTGRLLMSLGISSTIFGFLYGSVFGIEHILPALWLRPMDNIMYWLGIAIGFGVILIIISMIFNLVNSFRRQDLEEGLFSRNGLSGLCFYLFALFSLVFYLLRGELFMETELTAILLIIPLVLILLHRPLINIIRGKRFWPENSGEYFLESGFELFDTLISYLSNTISFVRIGAFTLNHVGLSMAVYILAGMIENNLGSIFIIVVGNILVMALEGLVVGIQVLRLEYFELFGKFFRGDGEGFSPVQIK